jgi:hypothetical protein
MQAETTGSKRERQRKKKEKRAERALMERDINTVDPRDLAVTLGSHPAPAQVRCGEVK